MLHLTLKGSILYNFYFLKTIKSVKYGLNPVPDFDAEPELWRNRAEPELWRNRNRNISKVGTGTAINYCGFTSLVKQLDF